jgi:small subunit ribosomal protein S6
LLRKEPSVPEGASKILACENKRNPKGGAAKMAKLNETYEAMVVFSLKNDEDAIKALTEKFKNLIEKNGTLTEEVNEWGKRKLAYPINYEAEGYYVLYSFTSKPDFPAELSRVLNITDGVLRALVTTK